MRLSLLLLPLLLAVAPPAGAETFPERPIRIIVPINPGGGTDIFARKLAELAGPMLGQNVITENRPGASGRLALEVLARARTALRQQPEGPARAARRPRHDPIPGKARAIAKPDSSITSLLCTYPEQAIIVFTVALCMAGMLQTAIH